MEAKDLASQLIQAEEARTAIAPFSDRHPDIDIDTAYAAQWAFVESKLDAGEQLTGAKLGLTSRAKQEAMGVAEPLYGWITSGMISPYGEPVDRGSLIHPRAEPEIAFLLGRDVSAPATVTSVLAATDAVFAAVDILDSRYQDFRFTLPDVIADNASAGRIVLGPQSRRPAELVDLRLIGCVLRAGGKVADTAAGAAVSGHPAAAVAWLANRLGARGQPLRAGWLVLSGGLTAPVPLEPGTAVTAEFDGLGSVEVYCRQQSADRDD
jgi:2-oxo-3-hexenedioate decarboxylase